MTDAVLLVGGEEDVVLLPRRWEGEDDPGDDGDLVLDVVVGEAAGGRFQLVVEEGVGDRLLLVVWEVIGGDLRLGLSLGRSS